MILDEVDDSTDNMKELRESEPNLYALLLKEKAARFNNEVYAENKNLLGKATQYSDLNK